MIALRYPPYTAAKQKKFKGMSELAPDFDRNGNPTGWFGWLWGLGAASKSGGLARWAALFTSELTFFFVREADFFFVCSSGSSSKL
jgi:hypothetical protein